MKSSAIMTVVGFVLCSTLAVIGQNSSPNQNNSASRALRIESYRQESEQYAADKKHYDGIVNVLQPFEVPAKIIKTGCDWVFFDPVEAIGAFTADRISKYTDPKFEDSITGYMTAQKYYEAYATSLQSLETPAQIIKTSTDFADGAPEAAIGYSYDAITKSIMGLNFWEKRNATQKQRERENSVYKNQQCLLTNDTGRIQETANKQSQPVLWNIGAQPLGNGMPQNSGVPWGGNFQSDLDRRREMNEAIDREVAKYSAAIEQEILKSREKFQQNIQTK
jgi:hypothetical protein